MKEFNEWLDSLTEGLQVKEVKEEKDTWPKAPLAPWHEEVTKELRKSVDEEYKPNYLMILDEQEEVLAMFTGDFPAAKNGSTDLEMQVLKSGIACKYRLRVCGIVIANELDYPQNIQKDDTAVFQLRITPDDYPMQVP